MLAAPLLVGVIGSQPRPVHLPLTGFWFAGYFAFFALSQWLKSRFKPRFRTATLVYSTLTTVLGIAVLVLAPGLARFVPLFVVPAGIGVAAAWQRKERSLWAGLATVAAAMLMTPVAFAAGHGQGRVWLATAVLTAYFAGTIFFVKSMIRQRGNERFRLLSVGYHVAVTMAFAALASVGVVPWWVPALLALVAARAAIMPRWRLTPMTVGLPEMVWSALTVVAAISVL